MTAPGGWRERLGEYLDRRLAVTPGAHDEDVIAWLDRERPVTYADLRAALAASAPQEGGGGAGDALVVLARLVALKDGPRDERYAVERVRVWEDARRVLLRTAHPPPAGVRVDREALAAVSSFCRKCQRLVGAKPGRVLPSTVDDAGYHAVLGSRIRCGPIVDVRGWDPEVAAALIRDDLLGRNDEGGSGHHATSAIITNTATAEAAGLRAASALAPLLGSPGAGS